jgi:hypothetical protein
MDHFTTETQRTTEVHRENDDPDLKGVGYVGEFVISQRAIYLIAPDGMVSELAAAAEIIS